MNQMINNMKGRKTFTTIVATACYLGLCKMQQIEPNPEVLQGLGLLILAFMRAGINKNGPTPSPPTGP